MKKGLLFALAHIVIISAVFVPFLAVASKFFDRSGQGEFGISVLFAGIILSMVVSRLLNSRICQRLGITPRARETKEERHSGVVTQVDPDHTLVTLQTPTGEEYQRYFETNFLRACGISRAGEKLELLFRTSSDGASSTVTMRITKLEGKGVRISDEELGELFKGLDLAKIRGAFGSHLEPE